MKQLHSKFFYKDENEYHSVNTSHKKNDKFITRIAYTLIAIGLTVVVSSSYAATRVYSVGNSHFAIKHLIFCFASLFCIRFFSKKLNWLDNFGFFIWVVSVLALIFVLFFSSSIKGASRWISVFGIAFQPSEFVKIAAVLEGSKYVEKNWNRFFITYTIPMILILLQPDLGNTILLFGLGLAQVITRKFNVKYIVYTGLIFIALLVIAYFSFSHVQTRIDVFLNPNKDLFGAGYQRYKAFLAMQNGGLFGRGFGKGIIKDFLPDAHTDFVFCVIVEEFGVLAGLSVILLFIALAYRVLKLLAKDQYIQTIQYSIIISILSSAWLNIASTLSLVPTKGLTLPLISYGGSGLVVQGILFGILLATTKTPQSFALKKLHKNLDNDEE